MNLRSGWKTSWTIFLLLMLVVGWAISPTQAHHCKGKHKNDPGCDGGGGEDPLPAEFDPEIVWRGGPQREGPWSILIANGDGSNPTTILSDGFKTGQIRSVSWSPDGNEILFARWEGEQNLAGMYSLPIFDGDRNGNGEFSVGTPTLRVLSDAVWSLKSRWSPAPAPDDNYWIAYTDLNVDPTSGDTEEVFLFNPYSGMKIRLTSTDPDLSGGINFAWSNDATRIAILTAPGDVRNEDIKIYSLTVDSFGNLEVVEPPVSLLLDNDKIVDGSNAAMLKEIAIDPRWIQDLDWANKSDRLIVNSDEGLLIVPVPEFDTQQAVADDTILVIGDTAVWRIWPSWSPDDTALIYLRGVDGSGTCPIPNSIRGKNYPRNLVIGMLDNPDVGSDPTALCDDETVLNSNGFAPEWWRGGVGFNPSTP